MPYSVQFERTDGHGLLLGSVIEQKVPTERQALAIMSAAVEDARRTQQEMVLRVYDARGQLIRSQTSEGLP